MLRSAAEAARHASSQAAVTDASTRGARVMRQALVDSPDERVRQLQGMVKSDASVVVQPCCALHDQRGGRACELCMAVGMQPHTPIDALGSKAGAPVPAEVGPWLADEVVLLAPRSV